MFRTGVFYHLVIFSRRMPGNRPGYKRVMVFNTAGEMEKWVEKNGQGIGLWVVPCREDNLPDNEVVGGERHVGWNGKQWVYDHMSPAILKGTYEVDHERAI